MIIYKLDEIEISTLKDEHKQSVLKYFSENDFNCDAETGALRPSNAQLEKIMDGIISGKDDESNIFVLKKKSEVIGYISMFVDYDRLTIGHIAVKKSERGQGYGTLLTEMAILVAENEGRDVSLYCAKEKPWFEGMGFRSLNDSCNYLRERTGHKTPWLPRFFVSVEEYRQRQKERQEKEVEHFSKFLNSGVIDILRDIDSDSRRR